MGGLTLERYRLVYQFAADTPVAAVKHSQFGFDVAFVGSGDVIPKDCRDRHVKSVAIAMIQFSENFVPQTR